MRHGNYVCSNSTFVANVAQNAGGAIHVDGSPIKEIINCTFIGNVATNAGGAVYLTSKFFPKIQGCTFTGNSVVNASKTDANYGGGAIYSVASSEANTVSNCTNRVLNAKVDIGCYESVIPFIGAAIIFR